MKNALYCIAVSCLFVVGCATGETRLLRSELTLEAAPAGRYHLHAVQVNAASGGILVSGHLGPGSRAAALRAGHVDVTITLPDGKVIADASGPLRRPPASTRKLTDDTFSIHVPCAPPAGSTITVRYHAAATLCTQELSRRSRTRNDA